jgi:hypothetical protein
MVHFPSIENGWVSVMRLSLLDQSLIDIPVADFLTGFVRARRAPLPQADSCTAQKRNEITPSHGIAPSGQQTPFLRIVYLSRAFD